MKLSVLVDNNTLIDRYFQGEPGVSYLIESEEAKILFDVGYSDLFLRNARSMDLDLMDVDYIALSHGHLDHTWGLEPLLRMHTEAAFEGRQPKRPSLVAHPHALLPRFIEGLGQIGLSIDPKRLEGAMDIHLTTGPVWLTDKLVFLGQIPVTNDFEPRRVLGKLAIEGGLIDDRLLDDTALAYRGEGGIVIITGCSHSGICNIADYARQICNEDRVVDIIGGLHLLSPSPDLLAKTASHLRELRLDALFACHCTDLESKIALAGSVPLREVGVGLSLVYR